MNLDLAGKRVLVTGSSHGIGLSIVKSFERQGALVVSNGRDSKRLEKSLKGLENCYGVVGDVTDPVQVKKLIQETLKILGGIDILVCNVGSGNSVSPGKETYKEWQKSLSINLMSVTNMVEAAIHELKKSKGVIVCISSICGCEVVKGAPVTYSVAKAALNAYIRGISIPLADHGVRINGVAPGNILFKNSVWDKKIKKDSLAVQKIVDEKVPLRKLGSPDDVANFVLWLSSPISNFVTGSIHVTDGGQTRN
jgi:NAD(P)-dependent dehydrogenase (short-subunit alcohol dehydrogenase family)